MEIQTKFHGHIDISGKQLLNFKQGIPGFEQFTQYIILDLFDNSMLKVLQSIEESFVAFIICDPWVYESKYEFDLNESVIKASSNETVLCAFERAGIEVPARCHTGECGFCRSKLVSGKVYIPEGEDKRRIADMQFNFIHPCCCYPESDLVVRIN